MAIRDIIFPSSRLLVVALYVIFVSFKAFIYKDNKMNCYVLDYVMVNLYNLFCTLSVFMILSIISIFSASTVQWINRDENLIGSMLILIVLPFSFALAYIICSKIKEKVLNFYGAKRNFYFLVLVVLLIVLSAAKDAFSPGYSNEPNGVFLILDMFYALLTVITLIALFLNIAINAKKENKLLKQVVEKEYSVFSKMLNIKQELLEMNHELKNYIASGSPQYRDAAYEYCKKIVVEIDKK